MVNSDLHVIVGIGVTGVSCLNFLKKQGIPVALMDSRIKPPSLHAVEAIAEDVPIVLGSLDQSLLDQAGKIILSPGISLQDPAIARQISQGKTVVGDIELFAHVAKSPIIAITGTNAKSTVTTLVGKMAQAGGFQVGLGGNLGVPALNLLEQAADLYVLELSSFQLETTYHLSPQVSTILNISPDHMDRYDSIEKYCEAKHRIYRGCHTAVCNLDDALTECKNSTNKIHFTLNVPSQNQFGLIAKGKETYLAFEDQILLEVSELPVLGKHYQANALAALALGHAYGLPMSSMLAVLREFPGLPHRCQFVRELHGVRWYNDSKGTNVGATVAAVQGLGEAIEGQLVLIAGGVGKNADFTTLAETCKKYVRHLVLFGEAAEDISDALNTTKIPISLVKDMSQAIELAAEVAQRKDSVLLSPACASFDMFQHFAHRGEVFMEMVNQLPQ